MIKKSNIVISVKCIQYVLCEKASILCIIQLLMCNNLLYLCEWNACEIIWKEKSIKMEHKFQQKPDVEVGLLRSQPYAINPLCDDSLETWHHSITSADGNYYQFEPNKQTKLHVPVHVRYIFGFQINIIHFPSFAMLIGSKPCSFLWSMCLYVWRRGVWNTVKVAH